MSSESADAGRNEAQAAKGFTCGDLVDWSARLPPWQQDALRRLLCSGEVTEDDIDELAELAKAPYAPEGSCASKPIPPSKADVAPPAGAPQVVSLLAISDISRVNALGKGPVNFRGKGMTVIYGENASGKSGIARILKKACRARDEGGEIQQNVFEDPPDEPPSASIKYALDGQEASFAWVEGADPNAALKTVHVFDAKCAAVQVEKSNRITYTPEILQFFRGLAGACDCVSEKIRGEVEALGVRPAVLDSMDLAPSTEAGRFIARLCARSSLADLARLCTHGSAEKRRIEELTGALASNAEIEIERAKGRLKRLVAFEGHLAQVGESLDDEACDRFDALVQDAEEAEAATVAAADVFQESSALPGLGTECWKRLWESARQYSDTAAYPNAPFPVTDVEALCVLCHQPLSDEARERFQSFEEFVKTDVQQRADKARADLSAAVASLQTAPIPRPARALLREADLLGHPEAMSFRRFIIGTRARRRHLLRKAEGGRSGSRPSLSPAPGLASARSALEQEVIRLEAASRAEGRAALETELKELTDRCELARQHEAVATEIGRLRAVGNLAAARGDCRTNAITLKSGEVEKIILTERLKRSFSKNLASLGFSELPVVIKLGRGVRGEHPYSLELTAAEDVPLGEVLSEGERACVALAGFLAELETTDNHSAVVFDDPVCSLDHRYRKRVAERLVKEAERRQVVILTHDVVFLYLLRKYCAGLEEMTLLRGYQRNHGSARRGPPWVAMRLKQRVGRLRDELQTAKSHLAKSDREEYERRASWIYDHLRQSWERAVEEVLLNQVAMRFSDAVQTQRLPRLTDISDSDVELVSMEMTRCSGYVHDEAGAVHTGMPDPDTVRDDIERLSTWVAGLRRDRGRD